MVPLSQSYRHCKLLTQRTAKNFGPAFWLLPRQQRYGMYALYAFMRRTDDLADGDGTIAERQQQLEQWRQQLSEAEQGNFSDPILPALLDVVQRHGIPLQHFHEVITGVAMDLTGVSIHDFADLERYCYHVASAVGLACIHLWGFRQPEAREQAIATGIAFQLTNILRDLREDAEQGRIYLPTVEWQQFDCPPATWNCDNPKFLELMRFQVDRAEQYYQQGWLLHANLYPHGQAIFQAMYQTYHTILKTIRLRNYDVFTERVRVRKRMKLRYLLQAVPTRFGW